MDSEPAPVTVHHATHKNAAARLSHFIMNHKVYALAAVIYLIIALVNFWPVTAHLASTVAGVGGDTYQSLWGIWFVGYSLFTLHHGIWSTMLLFFPIGANLVYQTFMPVASLLVTPFTAVSLAFGYNLIFFAGFCLSGVTMFILARYLTKNSYAAFIAGLIFTFSTFHIAQSYGHLDFANLEWIPLALYLFLRIVKEDHRRYLMAFGLSIAVLLTCFTADVQAGIVLIFLLIVIAVIYLFRRETRVRMLNMSFLKALLVFVVATFVLGAWAWIPIIGSFMHSGSASLSNFNDLPHNALWSDDLLSFFIPNPYNGVLGSISISFAQIYHGDIAETASYLTYTAILLALLGLWKHFKENRLWLALSIIFFILALGPILLVNATVNIAHGAPSGIPLPYQLYRMIPFFNTVREPGRFDLIVTIALAIMAAFGVKALTEHKQHEHQAAIPGLNLKILGIVAIVAILLLVESNGIPLSGPVVNAVTTNLSVPLAYTQLAKLPTNFSVLQLPIVPDQLSPVPEFYPGRAMYYQTFSHKQIVGGYTTRMNLTQQLSLYQIPLAVQATSLIDYGQMLYESPVNENYTNQTLLTLYNYDTAFIALDKSAYNQSQFINLAGYLYEVFGSPVYNDNMTTIFSTQNAISRNLYMSYVAYPVLSDWNQSESLVNGSYIMQWLPQGPGAVSVFAPYTNRSNLYNTDYHNQAYYINSTMRMVAASSVPEKLYIGVPKSATNYSVLASVNLTSTFTAYTFNVAMVSGPVGNTFFFIGQYANSPPEILNISFSRYR